MFDFEGEFEVIDPYYFGVDESVDFESEAERDAFREAKKQRHMDALISLSPIHPAYIGDDYNEEIEGNFEAFKRADDSGYAEYLEAEIEQQYDGNKTLYNLIYLGLKEIEVNKDNATEVKIEEFVERAQVEDTDEYLKDGAKENTKSYTTVERIFPILLFTASVRLERYLRSQGYETRRNIIDKKYIIQDINRNPFDSVHDITFTPTDSPDKRRRLEDTLIEYSPTELNIIFNYSGVVDNLSNRDNVYTLADVREAFIQRISSRNSLIPELESFFNTTHNLELAVFAWMFERVLFMLDQERQRVQ